MKWITAIGVILAIIYLGYASELWDVFTESVRVAAGQSRIDCPTPTSQANDCIEGN